MYVQPQQNSLPQTLSKGLNSGGRSTESCPLDLSRKAGDAGMLALLYQQNTENLPTSAQHPLVTSLLKKKPTKQELVPRLSATTPKFSPTYSQNASPINIPTYTPSLHYISASSSTPYESKQTISHLRNALVQKPITNGVYPQYAQSYTSSTSHSSTNNGFASRPQEKSAPNYGPLKSYPVNHQTSCACFFQGNSTNCPLHGGGTKALGIVSPSLDPTHVTCPTTANEPSAKRFYASLSTTQPTTTSFVIGPSLFTNSSQPSRTINQCDISQNQSPKPKNDSSIISHQINGFGPSHQLSFNSRIIKLATDPHLQRHNVINVTQPQSLVNGVSIVTSNPSSTDCSKAVQMSNSCASSEPESLVAPPCLEAERLEGPSNPIRACTSPLSPPQLTAAVLPNPRRPVLKSPSFKSSSPSSSNERTISDKYLSSRSSPHLASLLQHSSNSPSNGKDLSVSLEENNQKEDADIKSCILALSSLNKSEEINFNSHSPPTLEEEEENIQRNSKESSPNHKKRHKRKRSFSPSLSQTEMSHSKKKKKKKKKRSKNSSHSYSKESDWEEKSVTHRRRQNKEEDEQELLTSTTKSSPALRSHYRTRVYTKRRLCQNNKFVYKRYNKNAAYEEELMKEQRHLSELRARKRLRRRLAQAKIKIKVEPEATDQEEEEEETAEAREDTSTFGDKEDSPTKTPGWRGRGRKRRRLYRRSGLDMICKKKKPKDSKIKEEKLQKVVKETPKKYKKTLASLNLDGSTGDLNELKKLMVNKALGETVLHRATRQGHVDLVAACLRTGYCCVGGRDNAGFTPLHEAGGRKGGGAGHLASARLLLQHGADPNAASSQGGIRPLHDAVENGHVELVRLLLSYGADPTLATYAGATPLRLARSKAMLALLQGYLADCNGDAFQHWEFHGSSTCFDPDDSGFNVFDDIPSDVEKTEEDGFVFEISDRPHLPTFHIQLPFNTLPSNCVRLTDVLTHLGEARDEFESRHPEVTVVEVSRHEFELGATCNQLLTGTRLDSLLSEPSVGATEGGKVALACLDGALRNLLGIQTLILR